MNTKETNENLQLLLMKFENHVIRFQMDDDEFNLWGPTFAEIDFFGREEEIISFHIILNYTKGA